MSSSITVESWEQVTRTSQVGESPVAAEIVRINVSSPLTITKDDGQTVEHSDRTIVESDLPSLPNDNEDPPVSLSDVNVIVIDEQ